MRIDCVLMSGDYATEYVDFWGPVSYCWRHIVGVEPILFFVCDEDTEFFPSPGGCGLIKMVKRVEGVSIPLQAQTARLYGARHFPSARCLISDLDMLPLQREYFKLSADQVPPSTIGVLTADAYPAEHRAVPMCYLLGEGATFADAFGLDDSCPAFVEMLANKGGGWNTDEKYVYERLSEWPGDVVGMARGWENNIAVGRIDRARWHYDPVAVMQHRYIDSHSLRPYSRFRAPIDDLIALALGPDDECGPSPFQESVTAVLDWTHAHCRPDRASTLP